MNNADTGCMQFPACQGLTVRKHIETGDPPGIIYRYSPDKRVGLHTLFKLFDFV